MKYRLPSQILDQEIYALLSEELKRQKIHVYRARKRDLKEITDVSDAIIKYGLPQNLIFKKLPKDLGHGIFLHPKAKPILKGQIIAPYAGEVSLIPQNFSDDFLYAFEPISHILLTKEQQSRFDSKRRYHPRRLYAMIVDALKKGNFTRFINHSEKPNIVAEFFTIPANNYGLALQPIEVIYVAKKIIRPGEQLLVCYDGDDKSYWSALKIKPVPITPQTFRLDSSLNVISSELPE